MVCVAKNFLKKVLTNELPGKLIENEHVLFENMTARGSKWAAFCIFWKT